VADRRRIRLGLELEGKFRPLLGISVASDGGLILDMSRYAPLGLFRYGVIDIPNVAGAHTVLPRRGESGWTHGFTPKIHYHRSGELSANATGRATRVTVSGTPLRDIRAHQHAFIFMLRDPSAWQSDDPRPNDVVFGSDGGVESLKINGYIGDVHALKEPYASRPEGAFALDVEHLDGAVIPTMIIRLRAGDFGYYLWLDLLANPGFTGPPGPAVLLHAFDPVLASDTSTPTATIAAWAVTQNRLDRLAGRLKRAANVGARLTRRLMAS
jgi:hypothetical protein